MDKRNSCPIPVYTLLSGSDAQPGTVHTFATALNIAEPGIYNLDLVYLRKHIGSWLQRQSRAQAVCVAAAGPAFIVPISANVCTP